MSGRRTLATAGRVLRQLAHDPRTVGLLLGVPCVLLILIRYVFESNPSTFRAEGPQLLGLFPFVSMFVVASVAMLRERVTGTLERILTMPVAKPDILAGYGLAFACVAVVQVTMASAVSFGLLGLRIAGSPVELAVVALANALLGMGLGLFLSAFARTEFQAVQFLPAVFFPQVIVSGLFTSRASMAAPLRWASDVMPLSYAVDATTRAASAGGVPAALVVDMAAVVIAIGAALGLGAATLRRRTP